MNDLRYFFCDRCKLPSNSPECPNCFQPARELNIEHDCIECGNPLGECTCSKTVYCPRCHSPNVFENGHFGCLECEDCHHLFVEG